MDTIMWDMISYGDSKGVMMDGCGVIVISGCWFVFVADLGRVRQNGEKGEGRKGGEEEKE